MYDLIIRGDRVVTPHGVTEADLGIRGGRIAAVAELGASPPRAGPSTRAAGS